MKLLDYFKKLSEAVKVKRKLYLNYAFLLIVKYLEIKYYLFFF